MKPISEIRTQCPVCHGGPFIPVRCLEGFPVLPICTDADPRSDVNLPLDVVLCQACGLLQLRTLASRDLVYSAAHSEGIGATWAEHYQRFERFVLGAGAISPQSRVLEVGAGRGQVAARLANCCKLTVIEPNYGGPRAGLAVIDGYFDAETLARQSSPFDVVYSSHTLEHFYDFREYFYAAAQVVHEGGRLVTAVPNLEASLQAGYANALNFEHTGMLTLPHLMKLHAEFGFAITQLACFRDHGIYVAAVKTGCPSALVNDGSELMRQLFDRFLAKLQAIRAEIEKRVRRDVPTYLFGASQLSQFLFVLGLDPNLFTGLLDNAEAKDGKRLYGTPLRCALPGMVLPKLERGQVFINGGTYTAEIFAQVSRLAGQGVEVIAL